MGRALRLLGVSAVAMLLATVALGLVYPLAITGLAQVAFPDRSGGSLARVDGQVVGSRLAAQPFASPAYFQPRPSAAGYDPSGTTFANLGPNSRELFGQVRERVATALARERPYTPGLRPEDLPVDMVTTSGSGIDPHISPANARIQVARVAAVRGLPELRVLDLVDGATDGRFIGVIGERGVNVLELNLALDRLAGPPPRG